MRPRALVCVLFACVAWTRAVAQPSVAWSSNKKPGPIVVAPGQILTLYVAGIKASFASPVVAASLPLPVSLSGISVTIRSPSQSYEAPMFSVATMDPCASTQTGGAGCPVTAITIQAPYEISSPNGTTVFPPLDLSIAEDGVSGPSYPLNAQADNIHILTTCDAVVSLSASPSGGCTPLVVHARGALVTPNSPLEPGETVSIYATGLGSTYPIIASGAPSPTPPAPASAIAGGVYGINLGPSPSFQRCESCFPPPNIGDASFVGLAPGYVGLYQINFPIPPVPLGTSYCGVVAGLAVLSNFTITINGFDSFDGAGLCVDTGSHS